MDTLEAPKHRPLPQRLYCSHMIADGYQDWVYLFAILRHKTRLSLTFNFMVGIFMKHKKRTRRLYQGVCGGCEIETERNRVRHKERQVGPQWCVWGWDKSAHASTKNSTPLNAPTQVKVSCFQFGFWQMPRFLRLIVFFSVFTKVVFFILSW